MANLTVKTLPEELQKSTAIEGSQLFADLAEVGMVSSDQGAKDIIQDEKRLTEIETFVAPPVEELPTPEEIAKEKIDEEPKITNLRRLSKPSRRIYVSVKDIRPVKNGYGRLILSTPKGILTGEQARKEHVGGEILFEIW